MNGLVQAGGRWSMKRGDGGSPDSAVAVSRVVISVISVISKFFPRHKGNMDHGLSPDKNVSR